MKLLYIHQYVFDHSEPGFTKPIEILSLLKNKGMDAILISGMFSHITRRKIKKYRENLLFKNEIYDGVRIIRVSGIFNLNSFINKSMHHVIFMFLCFFKGLFTKDISLIYSSSPSPFAAFSGYMLSVIKKVPFVLEIRDLWPEDLVQEGLLKPGIISSAMEKLMNFLYKKAALIVAVTKGIKAGILKRNIQEKKVVFIPNSVNTKLFSDCKNIDSFRMKMKLGNDFVILYAGNQQISNALDKIIEAANILREKKDIKFVFVGAGEDREKLIKQSQDLGLDNVIFIDPQPKYMMPEVYAMADLSLVSLKNIPAYDGALPNKLLDSMASGKPVLLAAGEEAKKIIEEANCGIWVKPEDPEEIAKAIIHVYNNRDKYYAMGKNAKNYVISNFSNEKIAEELEGILKSVVASKSN